MRTGEGTRHLSAESLADDLRRIGIRPGDIVYARARVSAVGRIAAPARQTLVAAFRDALGANGTLVVPAFTGTNYRWAHRKLTFRPDTPSTAGVLANAVLSSPGHVRSSHPSHSFAAIGPLAETLLHDHGPDRTSFFPMKKLIAADAKMLLIGCDAESPGFSTVHFAQEELGLSQQHWTRYLIEARYEIADSEVVWRPMEDPGCSLGFGKMYPRYAADDNLRIGHLGKAQTLLAGARRAYEADRATLNHDPHAVLCDRPDCASCRLLRGYNVRAIPAAALRVGIKALQRS